MNTAATPATAAATPTPDQLLATVRSAQRIYDAEFANCPRSREWKLGARAGAWSAMGMPGQRSPYDNGTAQDDAWRSGWQIAHTEVRYQQQRGLV